MLVPVSRGITGHCGLEDYFKARWKALSSFVGREKTEMEKKEEGRKVQAKKRSGKTRTSWALTARNTKYKHNSRWSGPLCATNGPANQRRWNARIQLRVSKESSQAFAINSAGWSATARGVGCAFPTGVQGSRTAPRREVVSAGRPHDLHDPLDL